MSETLTVTLSLERWAGERGTYHLVSITGDAADTIATHAALHRMEFGKSRGFGSVKVHAQIGETRWKTSVFPMKADDMSRRQNTNWTLLVSKKVCKAEDLAHGDELTVELELI
ncbi:MAG: DUF1905 domain-containing protein [Erythrobacter sp.]